MATPSPASRGLCPEGSHPVSPKAALNPLLGQRDDFAEIVIGTPKRSVIRKLPRDERKQGNVDPGTD